MLCEKCHKRPATVHIKKIVSGRQTEVNLCQQCASQAMSDSVNPFSFKSDFMHDFSDMLAGFSDSGKKEIPKDEKKCPKCGSTYKDFKETGRLGCEKCYDTFQDKLDTLLRRLQGSIQHAGKTPKGSEKAGQIEELKKELQYCISKEEYERAAVIRDKIKELKDKSEE
ncbi:MAG: UvrB/UvrC motif-containing protein [Elusimicrobiota bacterium]|nr:UvrB/UvrC motif-containing protein [Elusimicrobiota bacterium]